MSKSPPISLRRSRIEDRHYHLTIDTVTDYAIFMLDPNGFIQTWNAGAKVLKGYEADEVIVCQTRCR